MKLGVKNAAGRGDGCRVTASLPQIDKSGASEAIPWRAIPQMTPAKGCGFPDPAALRNFYLGFIPTFASIIRALPRRFDRPYEARFKNAAGRGDGCRVTASLPQIDKSGASEAIPWRAIPQMTPAKGCGFPDPAALRNFYLGFIPTFASIIRALPRRFDRPSINRSLNCQRCPKLGRRNNSSFGHALFLWRPLSFSPPRVEMEVLGQLPSRLR